jgi:hypothetical protein
MEIDKSILAFAELMQKEINENANKADWKEFTDIESISFELYSMVDTLYDSVADYVSFKEYLGYLKKSEIHDEDLEDLRAKVKSVVKHSAICACIMMFLVNTVGELEK